MSTRRHPIMAADLLEDTEPLETTTATDYEHLDYAGHTPAVTTETPVTDHQKGTAR